MNDNSTSANNDGSQPPASSVVDNKAGSNDPQDKTDVVKMAQELGQLKAKAEEYDAYRQKTEPVLETIWSDQELFDHANKIHLQRTGKAPTTDSTNKSDNSDPKVSKLEEKTNQNRNFAIDMVVTQFNDKHGISKLPDDQKQDLNTKVAGVLREMLDPMGNKTLPQIMEDVAPDKLPKFLDNAYFLATKDDQIKAAKTLGKQEAETEGNGIIGSVTSGSVDTSQISLTGKEKETARKMGISEENYLKNKKSIVERDNQLY